MSEQTMQYKGYTALVTYTAEDQYFTGKVVGIKHRLLFGGLTLEETKANFMELIDNYPAMCLDQGVLPNQPTLPSNSPENALDIQYKPGNDQEPESLTLTQDLAQYPLGRLR